MWRADVLGTVLFKTSLGPGSISASTIYQSFQICEITETGKSEGGKVTGWNRANITGAFVRTCLLSVNFALTNLLSNMCSQLRPSL